MQEVKAELLEALKTSRPLNVTTVEEIKLYCNVPGHVSEEETEWNKVKEKRITYGHRDRARVKALHKGIQT